MKNRKNRKIIAPASNAAPVDSAASDLNVGADIVSAIGAPPDAVSAAPVAPPAPMRRNVGDASHVDPVHVDPVLTFNGATLNGIGTPHRRDAATITPLKLTADDVPALYARAAVLLSAAASATVNAPDRIGASPLDRMMFLTRAAERLIYTADRTRVGTRPVRAFSGGYNGTDAVRMRIASVASVADLPSVNASDVPRADICDPLIVAHLATRKTATRPDGGYFAVNVGTIDR